jgi:hypothetical protein
VTITDDNHTWIPQVHLGGKMPPGGGVEPYLLYMKPGSIFLARDKTSKDPIDLTLFEVKYVFRKARLVLEKDSIGNSIPHYVDPIPFCHRFEFYEVLIEGKEDDEPVNRSDTPAGNENHEPVEGVNIVDERAERR